MCLGAIYWARLGRVFYGGSRQDASAAGFDDAFIYEQVGTPREQRRIMAIQMMRQEALEALEAWQRTPDKIPY